MKNQNAQSGFKKLMTALTSQLLNFSTSVCCIGCLCLPSIMSASPGKAGEIFNFGAGAGPLAMGSAYTAVAKDAAAVYYNPAGLAMLPNRHVLFMHAALFEGAAYDFMGYAQNYRKIPGGWGANLVRLSIGGVEGRDEFNNETGSFNYAETAVSAGTGIRGLFMPLLSMGGGIKVLNRALAGSSDRLIGVDAGLQYGPFFNRRLNLGFTVQNAVSLSMGDTDDKLPFGARFGALINVIPGLGFALDVSDSREIRLGTEYAIGMGALRVGYDRQAVSFGGGMKIMKSYSLDVAMFRHPVLGMSQRISLGYQFGVNASKPQRPEMFARDFVAAAEKNFDKRQYVEALNNIERAIGLDPAIGQGPWGEKQYRLAVIVSGMKLESKPDRQKSLAQAGEQQDTAYESMKAYLEGKDLKALLLAEAALGSNTKESLFAEFLNNISKAVNIPVRREEIVPRSALVQEKLKKSAAAFYMQRYEAAVRECEEALLLDDTKALGWIRLGSSYYAMGDRIRSRKAYERALELAPEDKVTSEFMRMQGWK